jgi:hypothetical protein
MTPVVVVAMCATSMVGLLSAEDWMVSYESGTVRDCIRFFSIARRAEMLAVWGRRIWASVVVGVAGVVVGVVVDVVAVAAVAAVVVETLLEVVHALGEGADQLHNVLAKLDHATVEGRTVTSGGAVVAGHGSWAKENGKFWIANNLEVVVARSLRRREIQNTYTVEDRWRELCW